MGETKRKTEYGDPLIVVVRLLAALAFMGGALLVLPMLQGATSVRNDLNLAIPLLGLALGLITIGRILDRLNEIAKSSRVSAEALIKVLATLPRDPDE